MFTPQQIIDKYQLQQHPEGGWYKESYKSEELIAHSALPKRFGGDRHFSTAIYFLLESGNFSAFHRIKSDECWHFYMGGPLIIYILDPNGQYKEVALGADLEKGEVFQYVVPANSWFASRPAQNSQYSFVGCTVSPGFDFEDFELTDAEPLIIQYPQYADLIRSLTRS